MISGVEWALNTWPNKLRDILLRDFVQIFSFCFIYSMKKIFTIRRCVALSAAKRMFGPILQFLVVACWTAFHTLWCCSLVCWRPGGQGRPWAEGRPPTPGRLHSARGKRSDNNGPDDLLHPYTLPYNIHKFLWKRVDGKSTSMKQLFCLFFCLLNIWFWLPHK